MSYRKIITILLFLASTNIHAKNEALTCDDNFFCELPEVSGFCGVDFSSKLSWDSMSDVYILSCSCNCTSQENHGWLAKRSGGDLSIYKTNASLILRNTNIMNWNGLIPGEFGPSPLCSKIKANTYDLIALTKTPSKGIDPTPPYCYEGAVLELNKNNCSTSECLQVADSIKKAETLSPESILTAYRRTVEQLSKIKDSAPIPARKTFINRHINTYGYIQKYQQNYNDIAFFWQKNGYDEDAIWLLKIIIDKTPERTVAYLNIADSLWNMSMVKESIKNYKTYIDQMKAKKKEHLIPNRVFLRTSQKTK